jgi:ribulose-5-phosphate 4-epimerase/fuculose-1-phosphate aldolase
MNDQIQEKMQKAIWIGKSLFERNKVSGSSANMSFRHGSVIYITGSGTCFGNLANNDFAVVDLDGNPINQVKPSKELPLHLMLYHKDEKIQAVLHTHSFYATLWSCLKHEDFSDVIPQYTPYLKMKLGTVGLVPYGKPGSQELFQAFSKCIDKSDGFLLKNHGPIVGGKNLMSTFYILEELEESARIAWNFRNENAELIH